MARGVMMSFPSMASSRETKTEIGAEFNWRTDHSLVQLK